MTSPAPRDLPAPQPDPETQAFWDAAAVGRLTIKSCTACDKAHYYPRSHCPHCGSGETAWLDAAGTGEIYSLSVMRRGEGAPFAVAWVVLDEGPAMLTNIVDCDLDALSIGCRVSVRFVATAPDGPPVPCFVPADS